MAVSLDVDRIRAAWWTIGAALFVAVAFVIYYFVGTFVFAIFIYYATRPVYRRIQARVGNRNLAATLSLLALALPALLLLAYTLAVGLQEFDQIAGQIELGQFEEMLQPYLDVAAIAQDPQQLLDQPNAVAVLQTILDQASDVIGFVGNALLHLFVMIAMAFYLLRDDHRLAAWFRRRFVADGSALGRYAYAVDRDFSNIFFGNILNAAVTAVIGALSYNALALIAPPGVGVPYPTLLGLLTGVASLIPVVGMKLVYFPVAGYLFYLARGDVELLWFPVTFSLVSFVIVDTIPDFVLRPYVSGRGLHLGLVMFAYIFGPLLFGWYGIFLGPMLLVFVVHFVRLILPELLLGRPIEPEAFDPSVVAADEPSPDGPAPESVLSGGTSPTDGGSGPPGDDSGDPGTGGESDGGGASAGGASDAGATDAATGGESDDAESDEEFGVDGTSS